MVAFDLPLKRVFNARVRDILPAPTPLDYAPRLSRRIGQATFLKREDLTPVFSFKLRGAYNAIAQLRASELLRGVIAASAGNHAQGVAYAGRELGCPTRIVMPETTPQIKVDAVRQLGATVDLYGDNYSEAATFADQITAETGMVRIPPFDHPDVIAGQGTVALELLQQAPADLAAILVPIGGGGLAAGVAAVTKELRPHVQVIGVEPIDSNAMGLSLAAGHRVQLSEVGIFADGVAVKQVGELTFELCRRHLDEVVCVNTDEICGAIEDAFLDTRSILEPAGALSIAGLKRLSSSGRSPKGPAVAIASGANMSFGRLGYVGERAEVGRHCEALLAVTIPERPGAFLEFSASLARRSVTEFNYRLAGREQANIFVGVAVEGREDSAALTAALVARGYACVDLSEDDLAKTHVRHMVGGRSAQSSNEVLYSFEFPERPGALGEFLERLGLRWNISLFHYRNHGAAYGRVLCGLEVPPGEREALATRLSEIGFRHWRVGDSPAAVFLSEP